MSPRYQAVLVLKYRVLEVWAHVSADTLRSLECEYSMVLEENHLQPGYISTTISKNKEFVLYRSSYFNRNPRHADEWLVEKFDCFLSIFWSFEPNISNPSVWNEFYICNGCEFLKVFSKVILGKPRLGKVFDEDSWRPDPLVSFSALISSSEGSLHASDILLVVMQVLGNDWGKIFFLFFSSLFKLSVKCQDFKMPSPLHLNEQNETEYERRKRKASEECTVCMENTYIPVGNIVSLKLVYVIAN